MSENDDTEQGVTAWFQIKGTKKMWIIPSSINNKKMFTEIGD
jgi:hypothetical protein